MKSKNIAAAILLASVTTLAACGGEVPEPSEAAPEGVPGLTISNARVVLAPVAGNPAAVYFDLKYEGDRALSIRAADVAGAESAMLHDYNMFEGKMQMMEALPIGITKGTELKFEPGSRHVMAFNLSPDIAPGDTTEVTLTVSGGDKTTFEAEVRAAGEER